MASSEVVVGGPEFPIGVFTGIRPDSTAFTGNGKLGAQSVPQSSGKAIFHGAMRLLCVFSFPFAFAFLF